MIPVTRDYGTRAIPAGISPYIKESPNQDARDCLMPMGLTSENVAKEYNITRERQDAFAARSHQKAAAAQKQGLFDDEITPVTVRYREAPAEGQTEGKMTERRVTQDEGIRPTATAESMAKLKPALKKMELRQRAIVANIRRRLSSHASETRLVGVPPRIMGVGPAYAVPALLKRYGLSTKDIDIWEINEGVCLPLQPETLFTARSLCVSSLDVHGPSGA
ncbi:hypothetical protein IEQ34_025521 [Dendrobium chrysotoxum]|uniref:Acetyl-CoA C-acyltransferase n=1 Tax=Dendrobium chrysotoxum TaxID=161865 RepID=A0AAV7FPN7_DENCH|nr:hypothetical protein IEQ34_025521 [Dendrobium chrysotoxum]